MNDTTFQGSGNVAYVPVIVNGKLKRTNADRIRSMSDEELAEMFLTHDEQLYRHCPSDTFAEYCQVKPCVECCDCKACWLDWLRQDAEEGET